MPKKKLVYSLWGSLSAPLSQTLPSIYTLWAAGPRPPRPCIHGLGAYNHSELLRDAANEHFSGPLYPILEIGELHGC